MRNLMLLALLGCGGSTGGVDAPASIDGGGDTIGVDVPAGAFALTSPMLAAGGAFDPANTCTGVDTSPQLDWTGAPAGALSFAVVLTDKSNNLTHWVIYDIPMAATGLPANVEKVFAPTNVAGAHQTTSFQATVRGYLGPCPPVQHTYEFAVFAINAATLPGATMQTTRAQAVAAITANNVGSTTLTGTYAQP
jgi:Raf kinase inhibitor-like YbhB/YbcL family protein